jgi:hypothetical protein
LSHHRLRLDRLYSHSHSVDSVLRQVHEYAVAGNPGPSTREALQLRFVNCISMTLHRAQSFAPYEICKYSNAFERSFLKTYPVFVPKAKERTAKELGRFAGPVLVAFLVSCTGNSLKNMCQGERRQVYQETLEINANRFQRDKVRNAKVAERCKTHISARHSQRSMTRGC